MLPPDQQVSEGSNEDQNGEWAHLFAHLSDEEKREISEQPGSDFDRQLLEETLNLIVYVKKR